MGSEKINPLSIATFERHAAATDMLEWELGTALLGLIGEVGSLVSALKKKRRDMDGYFGYADAVLEELGDVLWYISAAARRGDTSLAEVAALVIRPQEAGVGEALLSDLESATRGGDADDRAFEVALLELAGVAGDLATRFTSGTYKGDPENLREDIIKLLRPLGRAAAAAEASLDEAGWRNITKIEDRWPIERKPPALLDDSLHVDEQLPRHLRVEIYEREVNGRRYVFQKVNGILLGSRLTDNHIPEDDYRFHDVFHLAYAAVLGWSPTIRALLKIKRKSQPAIDENEDGARAILIEEGLTTWIFETAKRHNFFANTSQLGLDLLKSIKQFVRGYESERLPMWLWESAILQGYAAFRELRAQRRGFVIVDMQARKLRFEPMSDVSD